MKSLLEAWEESCASHAVLRFVDINLRGVGQVMFQDNPVSGLFFIAAICWGSYAAGVPEVAVGGLLALVSSTIASWWLRVDKPSLHAGLYGFNAYLVGLALPTFLEPSALLWAYVAFGGAVSVVVTLAITQVLRTWGVSPLTAPFVLLVMLMLLAAYAFSGFEATGMPISGLVVEIDPLAANPLHIGDFLRGVLESISQVFLKGNGLSAILLVAGLAFSSVAAAIAAVLGAVVAVAAAHLLGAESELVTGGLLGYSPVLTAIALGTVFYKPGLRVAVYALAGVMFTVLVQGAINMALTPFGIPALTWAFVAATWLFLLPRLKIE